MPTPGVKTDTIPVHVKLLEEEGTPKPEEAGRQTPHALLHVLVHGRGEEQLLLYLPGRAPVAQEVPLREGTDLDEEELVKPASQVASTSRGFCGK